LKEFTRFENRAETSDSTSEQTRAERISRVMSV